MAKRFTDSDKWKKGWFRRLSPTHKVFWEYIRDNCDVAGVWEVDFDLAMFNIGGELDPSECLTIFERHVQVMSVTRWLLIDYIPFQYGCTADELNPSNPAHKAVIKLLKKYNAPTNAPTNAPYNGVLYMDKDKDKDKDKEKTDEKTETKAESYQKIIPYFLDTNFYVAWTEHRSVRKKKKGALTQRADLLILNALAKLTESKDEAIMILDQSSRSGWTGVFALNTGKSNSKRTPIGDKSQYENL